MLASEILSQDNEDALTMIDQLVGARNGERANRKIFEKLTAALKVQSLPEKDVGGRDANPFKLELQTRV